MLHGKTALVIGGSRGIGRGICLRLGAEGAEVIVHYHRNRKAADEVRGLLGGKARVVQADIAQPEQIEAMFAQLAGVKLDVLVICAGVWRASPVGGSTVAVMNEIVDTNLKGPFWVLNCASPLLAHGARVINISSVAGRIGVAGGRSLYGATKAAVDALTRNWALELAPRRILVNAISPGYVTTDMTAGHFSDPAVYENARRRHPLGRMGVPEDTAGVVLFLCSEDGGFITGQSINVSGGFVV
ncbi:MAG: SDR family oxidoreductase [Acidobacteria bacterium]|nr:SDR family oxidoreductase [Acidobacteriota bacterium]